LRASPTFDDKGDQHVTRRWTVSAALTALVLLSAGTLRAQEVDAGASTVPSLASGLAKGVIFDPTTYLPAALLYQSMRLDWTSSQPFFQHGFFEANERYTASGRGHDVPVSFAQGKRQILTDALLNLPMSFANNATSRVVERFLLDRYPDHPKLVRALGWIERSSFAAYMSNRLAAKHFRQWRQNEDLARQLGYK
jgi:hypothetical protein